MDDLESIFGALKGLMERYRPPLKAHTENERFFDLWSERNLVIEGRKRKEVYFAGIVIQKSYVGFYYMPVYVDQEVKNFFSPKLLKMLKGKSCFHVRKTSPELLAEVEEVLKRGFALYQQRGWVD